MPTDGMLYYDDGTPLSTLFEPKKDSNVDNGKDYNVLGLRIGGQSDLDGQYGGAVDAVHKGAPNDLSCEREVHLDDVHVWNGFTGSDRGRVCSGTFSKFPSVPRTGCAKIVFYVEWFSSVHF